MTIPVVPPDQRFGFNRHVWHWTAYYRDGSSLAEFGADGDHGFAEIDQTQLAAFQLVPVHASSGRPSFSVLIDPAKGQRPIFFRREVSASFFGEPGQSLMTCIGRSETANGRTVSAYVFFDDNGHVVIADNDDPLGEMQG